MPSRLAVFPAHLRLGLGGGLAALNARLKALLVEARQHWQSGHKRRKLVELNLEAQAFMCELQYRTKQWQVREYADINAATARAWEKTLRLAAVFHVVSANTGAISLKTVQRAWEIVEWSLTQHRLILMEVNQTKTNGAQSPRDAAVRTKAPRPNQSALSLKACIEEVCCRRNTQWVSISDIEALTDLPPMKLTKAWAWLTFKREVVVQGVGARASVSINRYPNQGSL